MASFYTYQADGIAFTSNCLSDKKTTVWLPTWNGSDPVTAQITLQCLSGDDVGQITYRCEDPTVTVEVDRATVECIDGQVQTLQLTIIPNEETVTDVTVQLQWHGASGTRQADFLLPVHQIPEQETQTPAAQAQANRLCYQGNNGDYRLLKDGIVTEVMPVSGNFPAYTWFSADGGESWNVMAYETDRIQVQCEASQLRLKGESFADGFYVNYENNESIQVLPENICRAGLRSDGLQPVISEKTAVELTVVAQGVTLANHKVSRADGVKLDLTQAGMQLMTQTRASVLTISSPDKQAQPGRYIFSVEVYLNGELIDTLETTFFVNYRYTG